MKTINSKNISQQLEKIQNINYTDPLTQNTLIHAALDGTILDSNLLVQVLEELYVKGANIEEPTHDPPINLAVTNDRSEAVFWFHQKNPILLQQIHPDTHMGLAHLAVQEGSLLALMALVDCDPNLINQTITDGDYFINYAPINYFLATLVSKIDVHLDQYLSRDHHVVNNLVKKEPHGRIVEDDVNIKCMIDFLLAKSSIDTFFTPRRPEGATSRDKFGTVLHALVRLTYFEGMEVVIRRLKSQDESLLHKILSSKDSDNKSPLFCALERSADRYKAAR